jgi:hypothetical protein
MSKMSYGAYASVMPTTYYECMQLGIEPKYNLSKKAKLLLKLEKHVSETRPENLSKCIWCNSVFSLDRPPHPLSRTIEHIIPESLGGGSSLENILYACYGCNTERGQITSFFSNSQDLYSHYVNYPHDDLKLKKTVKKMYKQMEYILQLQKKWVEKEKALSEFSILEAMDLENLPIFKVFLNLT